MKQQKERAGYGKEEAHERCELCNVPIFNSPFSDIRSADALNGRGKVLCSKCMATLSKIPTAQAIQALENASEMYER